MKTHDVVAAWLRRQPARTNNRSLRTDGTKLFSYQLEIGYYDISHGKFIIYDYRAPNNFILTTTSKHVSLACSTTSQVVGNDDDSYWISDPPNA